MKTMYLTIFVLVSLILSACSEQTKEPTKEAEPVKQVVEQALPEGHPAVEAGAVATATPATQMPQQAKAIYVGVVKETFEGGGYTYASVETNGNLIWLAGPASKLEIGSQVSWTEGLLMENFKSKSLDRTFERLYFVNSFAPSQQAMPMQANPMNAPVQTNLNKGIVEEAIASAGYVYIKVKTDTASVWLAAPETTVSNGEAIQWQGGAVMHDFQSKTLERTFDEIVFVDKITKG